MTPEHEDDLLAALAVSRGVPETELPDFLYTHWFTRWRPVGQGRRDALPAIPALARAAHAANDVFEDGWTAGARGPRGSIVAVRGDVEMMVEPGDFVNLSRPAAPVLAGDSMAVTRRRDSIDVREGWWYTWSADHGTPPGSPMVRLYWHADPPALPALLAALTAALERQAVSYLLKCPMQRWLFGRADAVVLYLEPAAWNDAKGALREAHARAAALLQPTVPPLTLPLGRGVAAAEDVGGTSSFGQSRSDAVAAGIVAVRNAGCRDRAGILASFSAALRDRGVDPVHPYLPLEAPTGHLQPW